MFRKAKVPPVIILGMHRSGTTMITKFLEELGIFFGDKKDDNNESLYFYKINYWIFRIGISKPDYPHNLQYMSPECRTVVLNGLDYYMSSIKRHNYLGKGNALKYKDIRDVDFRWGWKEPKNTFTVDFWKELFPNAKIIHIYRNPIDCAASYMKRDIKRRNAFDISWKKKLKRYFMIAHKYHQNFRIKNIADGYDLWREYVTKAFSLEEEFGDNMFAFKYEDFIDRPFEGLKQLVAFLELKDIDDDQIRSVIQNVDASRKYSFVNDDKLYAYYQQIKSDEIMKGLDYDSL